MKNILNLEMDKFAADAVKRIGILSGAFNFFSLQSFSFFNSALLGSLNKIAKVL
jgi:hypothetical protein